MPTSFSTSSPTVCPERIVDVLEAVEASSITASWRAAAPREGLPRPQAIVEQRAIRKPRQPVLVRQPEDSFSCDAMLVRIRLNASASAPISSRDVTPIGAE